MDIIRESDNDSENNHVLRYFKKYSQNPELSKYFTGPEASIKISTNPSSKNDVTSINKASTSNDRIDNTSDNPNMPELNQEEDIEHKNISPSSSIASIKKLEWDNGADIGYKNSYKYSTKKSASFPSLFVNDTSYLNEENSISKNTNQVRSMYHQLTFSPEPSCYSDQTKLSPPKTQTVDTSSNEAISEEHSSLSSGSEKNKSYLQKRIGQPNAYSTPYEEVSSKSSFNDLYIETPIIRGQEKPKRNLNENDSDESSGNCQTRADHIVGDKEVILHNNIDDCLTANPVLIEKLQPLDRNDNDNPIQPVNKVQREINLCLTKPVFVECIYSGQKYNMNKKSQTSFDLEKNSKSIQTELIQNDKKIIHSNSTKISFPQVQKIEYVKYKYDESNCDVFLNEEINLEFKKTEAHIEETSKEKLCVDNNIKKSENGFKKKFLTTAAKMEVISAFNETESKENLMRTANKSTLDYMYDKSENIEVVNPIKVSSIIGTNCSLSSQENISGYSKFQQVLHQSESAIKENSPVTSKKSATDEMILAEMISLNQSRDLNTDIKRSINILQKLLNSKKYDEATKKYYIKKIVEKIVQSKYSDDSTSSSEFFQPKKGNVIGLSKEPKIHIPKNKADKTIGSKIQLMQNIPWYPVHDTKYISKHENMDCIESETDLYTGFRKVKNTSPRFSKDDVDLVVNGKITYDSKNLQNILMVNSERNIRDTIEMSSTHQSLDHIVAKQPGNSDKDKINDKNWKYVKTLSERLLENRDKIGQGDYLLKIATNERQHQLSWIKNEIKHLNKLKEMLERKIRPKPEVEGLISSLLKMHVDDVKGFSKNHNVFICSKCSTSKVQCNCDCAETQSRNQKMKKSANLVSGYYTIQTQLDRHGNLLDLTVYDDKGLETYNYQHDGVADNVLITSKNRNTSIKLKPKAAKQICYMKSKECKCCGQLFSAPADKPEICCCFKCENANLLQESTSSLEKNFPKHCKLQLKPKLLVKKPLNICTCKKCLSKSKPDDQDIVVDALTGCHQSSSSSSLNYNIRFIKPKNDSKDVLCDEYAEQIPISESKCSCQKVTFRELKALDECICRSEELLRNIDKKLNQKYSITESSTVTFTNTDISEVTREEPLNCDICPRCRRRSLGCICCPRFLPKQPKLIGSVINGPKSIQKRLERAGTNRGRSTHFDSKPASEHNPLTPNTISSSSDSKPETKFPPTKRISIDVAVDKETNVKHKTKHKDNKLERNAVNSSALSPQSHLKEVNAGTEKLDYQAKKVQCCKACKTCNSSTSPRSILKQENYNKNNAGLSRTSPSRENDGDENNPGNCHPKCQGLKLTKGKSSVKKGCQCCACTDCGNQTKGLRDKNARCQCCVCENCGIQASLDGNNRKLIRSKWCQPKQAKTQVQRTISQPYSEKAPYRTQIINNQFEDELDLTDESLESIPSGNTLYITPTKYKHKEKNILNVDCLCKSSNSESSRSLKSQKALPVQVYPRYMKTVGRTSSITSGYRSYSQTHNTCSPSCSKSLRGICDSKVSFRIPQGVQYAVVDIACDAQQSIPFCSSRCKSGPCLPPCKSCSRKSCQPKRCRSPCETPCSKCSSSSCRPCPLSESSSCEPCKVRKPLCSSPCTKCSLPCEECSPPCKSSFPCKKCCSKQDFLPCGQCCSPCKPCLNSCKTCSSSCKNCSDPCRSCSNICPKSCKTCPNPSKPCPNPCKPCPNPCKPCPNPCKTCPQICKTCPNACKPFSKSCKACSSSYDLCYRPCSPCKSCAPCRSCAACKPCPPIKPCAPPCKPRTAPCKPRIPSCRPCTPPCRPCTPPCRPCNPPCRPCTPPCRPCTPPCRPCTPPCKPSPSACNPYPPPCKQCPPPCKQCPSPCRQCPPPCKPCPPPCKSCSPCNRCKLSCKSCSSDFQVTPPCKIYPSPCKPCPSKNQISVPCKSCSPCKQCVASCKCNCPSSQCITFCQSCTPCKEYFSNKQDTQSCKPCAPTCKPCPPCKPSYPKKQSSPCKQCPPPTQPCPLPCKQCLSPCKQCPPPCKRCPPCKQCAPCKRCSTSSKQNSHCKQYPPCKECIIPCKEYSSRCKEYSCPSRECLPPCKQYSPPSCNSCSPCKQCFFVEQIPDSFMLRSSPSQNYRSIFSKSCASPTLSASPSSCELPCSFSYSKENNSSLPNQFVYMSLGVASPQVFPCSHITPESLPKNVHSADNIDQIDSQETEFRKCKNLIYFQQPPEYKSSVTLKKFIPSIELINEPEEKCNLSTCAAMSLINCPFCSQSLSSNTYQNYWRPLTPKSISLTQMYESKLNNVSNEGYFHCPITATTRRSISINIEGSSYSNLPCGHNTLSFVNRKSSNLFNDIQKVNKVDRKDDLEDARRVDAMYGVNNYTDTYIRDESPNYFPSRVCCKCYPNDAISDESSDIPWKKHQPNINLMLHQSASDGFFSCPSKRNSPSPKLQYYPRVENKPCSVVVRNPNHCTQETFNINQKLGELEKQKCSASEKNQRHYWIEKYHHGNTLLCQPVIIYSSSHNQARTDFSDSLQASDVDISPHSAKWDHNQAHTVDGVSVTKPNTKSQSKKCCCTLDECKCCQTSTHEAKNVQYSAFKQCLCQTESKEETTTGCSCKAAIDVSCECKEKPCKCAEEAGCKCKMLSISSSNDSSSSTSKSLMSCICCKKEMVMKNLMSKLPLCNPCHEINQKRFYPYEYSNPLHSCLCYSLVDQNTLCQIKSALTELERLDMYQQYCEVLQNCKCCKKCGCKCKLPKKFKNGCAYFLKLEDACPYQCEEAMCKCEDSNGKSDEDGKRKGNYLPEVTVKIQNCKGPCTHKKKSEYDMQQSYPSVMAYLCTMKPDFIERAERRRRILRSATLQREEDVESRKLRFLDQVNYLNEKCQNQNVSSETKISGTYGKQTTAYYVFGTEVNAPSQNIKPRVFKSFKEMKDLTRRRYLHLSEVRNKKDVYKNKRLKEANRILANTFNKRLQRSTLKGNVDIPPCVRVISY